MLIDVAERLDWQSGARTAIFWVGGLDLESETTKQQKICSRLTTELHLLDQLDKPWHIAPSGYKCDL